MAVSTPRRLLNFAVILVCLSCAMPPDYLEGQVALQNAIVCLDTNDDFTCGENEKSTVSDTGGRWTISIPSGNVSGGKIVAESDSSRTLSIDNRTSSFSYPLVSLRRGGTISVWTTIVSALMENGDAADLNSAESMVQSAFGLPRSDFREPATPGDESALVEIIAEQQFGMIAQKYAQETDVRTAVLRAALEVWQMAATVLSIADDHLEISEEPTPANSSPVEVGTFHGNYAAIPVTAEMSRGQGLNETQWSLKGSCVEPDTVLYPGICANTYEYTYELVETVNELSTHMSIGASAKASVSVGNWDVVGVSGGFKFMRDTQFKDNALYIMFREERIQCGFPAAHALLPDRLAQFQSDYKQFQAACGDRYLSSLTSGGYFMGLIEVLVDDDSKRQEMILELSGKVLGITVYKKSWKTTFSEIASSYSCTTRILSSAFQYSNNLLTMSQVFDLYDEYILRMSNPDCADTEGPGSCAYMATFSPYETLTTAIPGNATTIRNNQENMRALETYYFETQDLLSDVDRILAVPGDYNIGNDVDAFSSPNDWTRDSLVNWRNQVKGYQNTTTTAWGRCYLNILNCTAGPVGKGLPTWLSLKNALPTRKFILPQDCASLADKFGTTDDGEYTLYLGGNATRNYQVYCQDMATSVPKTFLILGNTSANTATPTWNFATYRNGSDGAVSRTFESLEVEPKYDPSTGTFYLRVVPGQKSHTAFAVTESFPVGTDTTWIASTVTPLVANAHGGATATANLNLEGTPFVIPADISITEDPTCTPLTVVLSPDGHNIDVEATGDLICNAGVPNLLLAWGSP